MESGHRTFKRESDGVLGVGFVNNFAGWDTALIAWPDSEPQKCVFDDLKRNGISEVVPIEPTSQEDTGAKPTDKSADKPSAADDAAVQQSETELKETAETADKPAAENAKRPPAKGKPKSKGK